jgi:hypothetical protein
MVTVRRRKFLFEIRISDFSIDHAASEWRFCFSILIVMT